jgi:beta-lactamase superfamily II metal-dependent hydrolase
MAKPSRNRRKPARKPAVAGDRLIPPPDGAVVRMYRIGHGDCFLLAFPGSADKPVYVLIDCGYKPGSPGYLHGTPKDVAASIREATGGHIDVVVITHEHQDHVNAFTAANFEDVTVGQAWFAWTEDPEDDLANKLRKVYKDKLLGLVEARNRLAADVGAAARVQQIEEYLAFEIGGDGDLTPAAMAAAAKDPSKSANKQAMKLIKDKAQLVVYLRPHEKAVALPGAADVRVFALGPPRDEDALSDLDPQGDEEFHLAAGMRSPVNYFAAAVAAPAGQPRSPFSVRFTLPYDTAHTDTDHGSFFSNHYGHAGASPSHSPPAGHLVDFSDLAPDNAEWRRIDTEWLHSADELALAMNNDTNNASLVLAFEFGRGGKVLLFAADAQRGNWISWADAETPDGNRKVSTKDLLGRTVLYKVGHHCSHNATLAGGPDSVYPNLGWMAIGDYAGEFTAMITAVRAWAETQKGWDHPRKEIKDALIKKAAGRVFQTDTDSDRSTDTDLYFDLTIKR